MIETPKTQVSPEQKIVVDTWGRGLAVLAGAGSGKTTTLVTKCIELLKLKPKAKFAAVSFTERSASDLRAKLSLLIMKNGLGSLHPHWVMTIHGLCGSIIREFPREAGYDGEENVLAESEAQLLWERAIEALWLEPLADDIRISLELLLDRESRDGLASLLKRVRDLFSFGVLDSLKRSTDPHSQALEKSARYVLERYERLKRRQGALDFNDLERGAARALESAEVREAYHRRFELILVDEFQDTNPLQARIIWNLARTDASNLCVVGDPKQSIYRFRDADVTVFEEYCAKLAVKQSLTWNFRSRPGIIDFVNQVCEKPFATSQMQFEALVPMRETSQAFAPVVRLDVRDPLELAAWVQSEQKKGVALEDMALLVRKIRGNEKWLKAFTSSGIPIAVGSGGLFWEDPRVRELVAFLKWWDNPGNTFSGAVFLRAPWMRISDLELDQWVKKDLTWREPFFASRHPVAIALKTHLGKPLRPAELLMALLVDQEIEDELGSPLLGLWHRVEEYSSRGLDFHAIVAELSSAVREGRRERDVPAPRNLGQLSVLTLHGSKGLEFPHVILIDLGEKSRASDTPLLFWDREQGAYLGTRDAQGERQRSHPQEAEWRESEKRKNLAESKRLFYVALTRARERLVLVCPELKEPEDIPLGEDAWNLDFWRAWIETSGDVIPRVNNERLEPQLKLGFAPVIQRFQTIPPPRFSASRAPKMTRIRHSVTEWTLLSRCPQAYEWTFIRPPFGFEPPPLAEEPGEAASKVEDQVQVLDPTQEGEAESKISNQLLGTRVHSYLERADWDGLKNLELEVGSERFLAEPVIRWAKNSPWMAPARLESGRDVWTELPFEVPIGNEILVGSIDRLVLESEQKVGGKKYSLIDFKVTQKPKPHKTLLQAYQTQIELYAWALTSLEKNLSLDNISAYLVHISATGVQTVSVPLGGLDLNSIIRSSLEIVNGKPGKAKPGSSCKFCKFRMKCPDAQAAAQDV